MGCFSNLLGGIFKYFIFIFNLIFVLAGITLLVLGILIEVRVFDLSDYMPINIHVSAIILMTGGAVAIVISFLGCCGAIMSNRCLLNLYAGTMLLAFSLQLAGAIVVFVWNPQVVDSMEAEMKNLISHYPVATPKSDEPGELAARSKKFWDTTQTYFECCGIRSKLDWGVYVPELSALPDSCKCVDDYYWYNCDAEGYYATGCFYRLKDVNFDLQEVMAWVAIGVSAFELVVGIMTLIYANAGGKNKKHQRV